MQCPICHGKSRVADSCPSHRVRDVRACTIGEMAARHIGALIFVSRERRCLDCDCKFFTLETEIPAFREVPCSDTD